jgi:HD superfamily phosphodiesterase
MVLGALLHDVGMAPTPTSHAEVGGALLRPYVEASVYEIVKTHEIADNCFRGGGCWRVHARAYAHPAAEVNCVRPRPRSRWISDQA